MSVDLPKIKSAIIGGSTGFKLVQDRNYELELIGRLDTPFGDSAPVHLAQRNGFEFLYISRHGERGYDIAASFVNYRANTWALKELGVERIVGWSGPAAIDTQISIGEILVPGDLVDETRRRETTLFDGRGLGFIRQNPVFCPELGDAIAHEVAERRGKCRTEDVYVCTEGPRLETPAEIRKFAAYGGTLVGMTLVPEVFLAKELEICYSAVCYVTNYAEGIRKREFRPGVLFEGLLDDNERTTVDSAAAEVADIAIAALSAIESSGRSCRCGQSMERYRKRGDIGGDWHTWILSRERKGS